MNKLFEKICEESLITKEVRKEIDFYNYDNKSFNFTIDIDEDALGALTLPIKLDEYEESIRSFQILRSEKDIGSTVDKNSALFVFVKCTDTIDWSKYRKQVLLLEEDEFYMKKYVILYTDQLVKDALSYKGELIETLQKYVLETKEYEKFYNLNNDSFEYSFIVHLFLKIPFLSLPEKIDAFKGLSEFIEEKLNEKERGQMDFLLEEAGNIERFEFLDEKNDLGEYLKILGDD
jgi:hypothetical protein